MMRKSPFIVLSALIAFFVLAFNAKGEPPRGKQENTEQVVAQLIGKVEMSNLTFIRNGERHSSEEAAKHLSKKYEYFKPRIETPEDFIRLCASRSLVSGEPYLVVTPQGTMEVSSWLEKVLAKYRGSQEQHGSPRGVSHSLAGLCFISHGTFWADFEKWRLRKVSLSPYADDPTAILSCYLDKTSRSR